MRGHMRFTIGGNSHSWHRIWAYAISHATYNNTNWYFKISHLLKSLELRYADLSKMRFRDFALGKGSCHALHTLAWKCNFATSHLHKLHRIATWRSTNVRFRDIAIGLIRYQMRLPKIYICDFAMLQLWIKCRSATCRCQNGFFWHLTWPYTAPIAI